MLLRKLVLHNIRSYTDQTIEFPEGIVLLAGDIGAGKSTLLLAIEFALFGIQRSEYSGAALLRNGERQAWVDLTFELGSETIQIVRTLKRGSDSIAQHSGYIMRNGVREDCTATELKARVLALFGYPADLLAKGKSLLFRYTVYTPQEEMKRILEESANERLATLRRLFEIDKYERIQANAKLVAQSLREKERELDGKLSQLPQRTTLATELGVQQASVTQQLEELVPKLEAAKKDIVNRRTSVRKNEQKLNELFAVKRELSTIAAQQRVQEEQRARLEREAASTGQVHETQQPTLPALSLRTARGKEAEQGIADTEQAIATAQAHIVELKTKILIAGQTIASIQELDSCPTCKQEVTRDYKERIITAEHAWQQAFAHEQEHYGKRVAALNEQLARHRKALETVRKQDEQAHVFKVQQKLIAEKRARIAAAQQQLATAKNALQQLGAQHAAASQKLSALEPVERLHTTLTRELEQAQEREKQVAVRHGQLVQQRDSVTAQLAAVQKELASLESERKRRERVAGLRDWVSNRFVPLVASIESHVLAAVHREFGALFGQWFSLLVDDPVLSARISPDFSILVQQNGYDTAFEHLSGGERTACALAYRLALNRVVNSLVSSIATQDLLILDEPTDGFSSEQLEKVRDVLNELQCKQVLLVSHEPALEGFADHVLRVSKQEHESTVA